MSKKPVRVRIAPSPTGYLHVGTARTAVFNWLFARHTGGKFLVRIEDTDKERSKPELIQPILDAMEWLGLGWDEEIVYQSRRSDMYAEHAKKILDAGAGYRCFCTPEELAEIREKAKAEKKPLKYDRRCLQLSDKEVQGRVADGMPWVIRLKIPDGTTTFTDMVAGEVSRHSDDLEDLIIARSDGSATYNLAVVVDDHDMGVTHVIRGNDHITNTFKQIHMYHALGWGAPVFGHLPLILRPDKKKVSKRLGDKDVNQYSGEGILPEAMVNYLSMLGWNPKTDREIYSIEELVQLFTPKYFNTSNAVFDEEKLEAFNREHIQLKSDHELAVMVAPMLVQADLTSKYWLETRWKYLCDVIGALKERVRRVSDFVTMGSYFFDFDYKYDETAAEKNFAPEGRELLEGLIEEIESLSELTHDSAEAAINAVAEKKGVKRGKVIHPTRLAAAGVPVGPSLYEMLALLGREIVLERLRKAVEYIRSQEK